MNAGSQPLFGSTTSTEDTIASPTCQNGTCVNTGVPCFIGAAVTSVDVLNRCTTGTCLPYDNCVHLGLCGDGAAGSPLVEPPPSTVAVTAGGTVPAPGLALCADLPAGQGGTVYVTGSSGFPALLADMAPLLSMGAPPLAPGPAVVFVASSSCRAADAIFGSDAGAGFLYDPPDGSPAGSYAQYFLPDGGTIPCSLGPSGTQVDVGESDVYATTCNPSYVIATQVETDGPIQTMEFVVPSPSDQLNISEEAAREVFGSGGNGGVARPWTNPARFYVSQGDQEMVGAGIGVPPNQFWGTPLSNEVSVSTMLQLLASDSVAAEQAIGVLSSTVYDAARANLRALAYQSAAQSCAFLPDSTIATLDKQNVRDGHYPLWGPLHFFASNAATAAAEDFMSYFNGAQTTPAILDAFIDANLIPNCAMRVLRSQNLELSPLVSYMPTHSCECYYLSWAQPPPYLALLPSDCTPCSTANDCTPSRPACNFGYCEVE